MKRQKQRERERERKIKKKTESQFDVNHYTQSKRTSGSCCAYQVVSSVWHQNKIENIKMIEKETAKQEQETSGIKLDLSTIERTTTKKKLKKPKKKKRTKMMLSCPCICACR